jgi:uncharacterized protein (TIGR03083 family)
MPDSLPALRTSVERLASLVEPLDDAAVAGSAYPTEWTVADVLSHLGSGAIIWRRIVTDALAGQDTPDGFNQGVWDEWNAKAPRAQADDALAADAALIAYLDSVPAADQEGLDVSLGPMQLDWDGLMYMRMAEHVVHEWDVAVALDPSTTLAADGTALIVDSLEQVAGWANKPVGTPATVAVATTAPERSFALTITDDSVSLAPTDSAGEPTLTMPAESLVRLIYGRLDPAHTPAAVSGDAAELDRLRQVFPGF